METHFNTENIDYIKFYPRHKSDYRWYPPIPKKTFFFGLLTDYPALEGGWASDERDRRVKPEYLVQNNQIYIHPEGDNSFEPYHPSGRWEKKAYVYIRTKQTDHGRYFETDDEAEAWIKELEKMSGAEFAVIVKKN